MEDVARALAQAGGETVFLAEQDGQPTGFACACVCGSMCYPNWAGELTELYVRLAGAGEISVLTGLEDLPAQALYEKCGFRPSSEKHYRI